MKNLKEKGITLVALVVTIIILLILAGVTLNIALSENGLFRRARESAKRYENASENETEILGNLDKTLAELSRIGSSEVANNLKEYQGKYVDIGLDINNNEITTDDWEIFYAGNGRIFLIAADYVPTKKLEDWSVIGDTTTLGKAGFKSFNKYSVYWPDGPKEFLNKEGLTDDFLRLVMHDKYDLKTNENNTNSKAVSHLLNTKAWEGIKTAATKKDCIDFVIGGPTLEMWCAAWKEAVVGDEIFKPIEADSQNDGTGYRVTYNGSQTGWLYMNGTQNDYQSGQLENLGKKYKTFFPHLAVYDGCDGYRVASPTSMNANHLLYIRYNGGMFYDDIKNDYGVRPIVSLKSNVRIVEKKPGGNEYNIALTSGQN